MGPMGNSPEEIRLHYLYRRFILRGGVRLPLEAARKLVGPDCAYHLYSAVEDRSVDPASAGSACAEVPRT
jgi:hypothetical protein